MAHIAIDLRNIGKGRTGDEVVFFELVRHLARTDTDTHYHLLFDRRDEESLQNIASQLDVLQKKNFTMHVCGNGNKFLWNAVTMPIFCRRHKIDVYHTQYIIPLFMPRHTKIVTHIHDVSFRVFPQLITMRDAFFLRILIPYALYRADRIIAVSAFTKKEIIAYYKTDASKIAVIPNAVSMHCDPHLTEEIVQKKYGLPQKYLMALGTMQPRKNIPFLIEVFARVAQKIPDISLVLVGKKAHNFDQRIVDVIAQYPDLEKRIVFTGYVSDAEKCLLYKMATVFVFPSLYEGFGVPILEALEMGSMVVASDIAAHREVGGERVVYANPRNVDRFVEILYDCLVNDSMKKNIHNGAQRCDYSWARSAHLLQELYNELMRKT